MISIRKVILFMMLAMVCAPCASEPNSVANAGPALTRSVPRFEAAISEVPDLQPWGHAAEALCQVWYPKIVDILHSDDSVRPLPSVVKIYFEKDMRGVAYSSGGQIHISASWVRSHPNDFGMVIHELTHLVQRYPRNRNPAGWLVEGIADYVRLGYFEPLIPRPPIDFTRAKYTDAYKTTASFLIWLEGKYGTDLVPKLNAALRDGSYSDDLFKKATGKEVAQLWSDFAAAAVARNTGK